jgi:creatinine amidohydrolase
MKFAELKRPDIETMDKAHKVVMVPLGSFEQHGQHLPLITDSLLGGVIAERVEAALPETVLLMPVQWLGASNHHLKFPGTVSIPTALYIDMVSHICECLLSAGFVRIFLHLSHGGNDVPCQEVIHRLGLRHRARSDFWIASAGYWALADDAMQLPEMETSRPTHACEYETSMVLAVRADLVDMTQAVGQSVQVDSKYYVASLSGNRRSKVHVALPFEHLTATGAIGRPELGTAAKGERLLDVVSQRLIDFVKEFAFWPRPQVQGKA